MVVDSTKYEAKKEFQVRVRRKPRVLWGSDGSQRLQGLVSY